jgi:hypothetical protein
VDEALAYSWVGFCSTSGLIFWLQLLFVDGQLHKPRVRGSDPAVRCRNPHSDHGYSGIPPVNQSSSGNCDDCEASSLTTRGGGVAQTVAPSVEK